MADERDAHAEFVDAAARKAWAAFHGMTIHWDAISPETKVRWRRVVESVMSDTLTSVFDSSGGAVVPYLWAVKAEGVDCTGCDHEGASDAVVAHAGSMALLLSFLPDCASCDDAKLVAKQVKAKSQSERLALDKLLVSGAPRRIEIDELRPLGWRELEESWCDACGLAACGMDEHEVCPDCHMCAACHEEDDDGTEEPCICKLGVDGGQEDESG